MQAAGTYGTGQAASRVELATNRRPELLTLTSVRFFAALEVVLLHTLFELGGDAPGSMPGAVVDLLTSGGLAVSFFFVLSGFILTYTYCDSERELETTPRKFWRARFARIYPVYFLGFLLDAPRAISFFLSSAGGLGSALVKIGVAGLAYLSLLQAWHPRLALAWNTPGWSLSVEALFYALFPVLLRLSKRLGSRTLCGVALALWALPMCSYALVVALRIVDPAHADVRGFWRSFPPLHLPEFVLGIAVGRLFLVGQLEGRRKLLRALGAASFAAILLLSIVLRHLPPVIFQGGIGAPLFALAILALASDAIPTPNWLRGRVLVLLGRASYAVYVLHQPFKLIFQKLAHWARFDTPSPSLLLTYLLLLQLFCVGVFVGFEDPVRRVISRWRAS